MIRSLILSSCILVITLSSPSFPATSDDPKSPSNPKMISELTKDLAVLNERIRALESRLDKEVKSIEDNAGRIIEAQRHIATQTIEAQRRSTDYITWVVGALVAGLGIFGVTQVWRLRTYVNRAKKEAGSVTELRQEAAKNKIDVKALVAVTRVMSRIWQSDMATNSDEKKRKAKEALVELEEAQRLGDVQSTALLLEKGKALKRLENYAQALVEADRACQRAKTEDDKFDQARALYNSACYLALLGRPREALEKLESAIQISGAFKLFAAKDQDLISLAKDSNFRNLIS